MTPLVTLTRQLADLTGGGLPLSRSVAVALRQAKNRDVQKILRTIKTEIDSGKSFSESLSARRDFFPALYLGFVRAGESSGTLDVTLGELANLLDQEEEIKTRVHTALIYPALLLGLSAAVCLFLTFGVIPRFQSLFDDLGQNLPLPTRILMHVTIAVRQGVWLGIPLIIGATFAAFHYRLQLKRRLEKISFSLPGLASLTQTFFIFRWTHMMAALLKNGFTISDSVQLTRRVFSDSPAAPHLNKILALITEGKSLTDALAHVPFFPPMIGELVYAGEESGRLDETLLRIAQNFRRDWESNIKRALSLLEPALILIMGAVVGFVALAMLLPIFEMSGRIK